MKLLYVFSIYLPLTGGCQDPIDQAAPYLTADGHEVHVLTKRWPTDLAAEETINTVHVHRIESAILPNELVRMSRDVRRLIDEIEPDAIHVIGARRPLPFFALMAARYRGIPVVMTIGGWDIPDPDDPEPGKVWDSGKHLVRGSLLQADQLNAASTDLTRLVRLEFPHITDVPVMQVGIDCDLFAEARPYAHHKPYVLSLRRLEESKQVDRVISAFTEPPLADRNIDLLIAGDGQEAGRLRQLTDELRLTDRVKFLGEVDISTAARLLAGAEATVVASRAEGGGLVNVEAQAAGTPVIATNVGGITEYVGGEHGAHFISSASPEDIASAIVHCIDDAEHRKALIAHGLRNARKFDTRELVRGYLRVYESLAAEARTKRFEPWSDLTSDLWSAFSRTDTTTHATATAESVPVALHPLGKSAQRWWYTRNVILGKTIWSDEDNTRIGALRSRFDDNALMAAFAEAAEWGRTDLDEVATYGLANTLGGQ
ncbi:hypothetical protein BO226_24625 (plasmid) [Rhodococcus sp. 2G]|uniref:glycosyltransferase family 4 protein n=1 Tax=Rhodococcus sp. 2G TaxID=1570939 RepID=UPI000903418A|nr:glycosyltransferase family 4 protein [Rhodococcus sp. 2G]APE12552.1 hypothetical protein BO226_24625 [Rhodococcus sp. 2G]